MHGMLTNGNMVEFSYPLEDEVEVFLFFQFHAFLQSGFTRSYGSVCDAQGIFQLRVRVTQGNQLSEFKLTQCEVGILQEESIFEVEFPLDPTSLSMMMPHQCSGQE